jgi:hypothetical protein
MVATQEASPRHGGKIQQSDVLPFVISRNISMIAVLAHDMLFAMRVSATCREQNVVSVFGGNLELIEGKCGDASAIRMWMVDLGHATGPLDKLLQEIRQKSPRTQAVAFGSHVLVARLNEARAAGFDHVMTRGQFDQALMGLVERVAAEMSPRG